ncbi:hypothetical protein HMSSN036_04250 [Paenibacillus macerans]|nr:hypothetical protein HMSSN036_04250 [Paenibacillus macerans]
MTYAPVVFLSAKTKQRLHKLLPVVQHVADQHAKRVQTHLLNDVVPMPLRSIRRRRTKDAVCVSTT